MEMPPSLFPLYMFFTVLSFVWGSCIGSFLNVCIHRIPLDQSVVKPRSHCPHCGNLIPWHHNIPLFSFVALGAKCANCGEKISARYFLVELLVAVLFLLVWLKFDMGQGAVVLGMVPIGGADWILIPIYWMVVSGLVLGTFVDFEHLIIPDRVTLGGIAAGLLLSAAVPALHGESLIVRSLLRSVTGLATGWGILWLISVVGRVAFKKDAMGFGDVKLMGAIGAFFGWQAVMFTLVISSLAGSIVGIALVLCGRKAMQSRIPYGPYIALAALLWMLWGAHLCQAYIDLMTPARMY